MPTLKFFHVIFVTLSVSGFFLRGVLRLSAPDMLDNRFARTVPHVNDTLLLVTGIALVAGYGWNPFHHPWLEAKLAALLVYIGLGSIALGRRGERSRRIRAAAWLAALAVFAYIVVVAIYKTPRIWLVF
ncbi:SirB2 family protein [Thiohalomonas denitrificans]|uniref:SirB2 family protein n=1 Tax=Thiohalomonas denitrificans TaxID=415747 RepID=UPI0026EE41E5|nr:SirB2 family protein [Thiohalomonas denitrificans]